MGDYFIRMDDATELRRKTLESSKASINILRDHNKLMRVRKAKLQLIQSLRREFKDLTILMNRLEKTIPKLTKSEVRDLNPELPELKGGKSKKSKKKKSRKKAKKSEKSEKEEKETQPESEDVYIGRPEPKKPEPKKSRSKKPEERKEPKSEPKSKEEIYREKLSSIEKKLQKL